MTHEEIDIMWQKAMCQSIEDGEVYTRYHFAKLVAERALADCLTCEYHKQRAQIWRDEAYKLAGHPLPERDAVLEEREACAKVCDGLADMHEKMNQWGSHKTADTLAQAIRARGQA